MIASWHLEKLRAHSGAAIVLSLLWLALLFMFAGSAVYNCLAFLFGELLIILAIFDYYYYHLFNTWVAGLGILALLPILLGKISLLDAVSGSILGGIFMYLLRFGTRGGIGLGDVKLSLALGLWLGFYNVIVAIFLAFLMGGLFASYLLLARKSSPKTRVAFGPFLAIGGMIAYIFAPDIWELYRKLLW